MSTNENSLPESILQAGKLQQVSNRKFLNKLKRNHPSNLDKQFQDVHDEVFEKTDCLTCGNCCRTTSPIFNQKDIEHLSKRLRLKPAVFIANYIRIDEDDDFVLKTSPCPFLSDDNSCNVYEDRPTACRTYPHTDRKRIHQLLDLTYENSFICPAVQQMLEKLKTQMGFKELK